MARYALLILSSANRAYADSSVALTQAELALFGERVLGGRIAEIGQARIGGVPYVTFAADELGQADVAYLANLSSIYALFLLADDGALRPVELVPLDRFDDDLITILKYQGKTNEQFTKLLINVTVLSSAFAADLTRRKLALADPLCGRGTSLSQALMYGWDASGIDLDGQGFEAYSAFIRTWLKRKRIKHHADAGPVRRDRRVVARRLQVSLAAAKDEYKAGMTQHLDVVNADTTRARDFFRPASFDLLVADLPYGVRHASKAAAGSGPPGVRGYPPSGRASRPLARSPVDLLSAAAGVWAALLRPGGALGIAWNTFVARRETVAEILAGAGLDVLDAPEYLAFRHRVDQAITRDILIARRDPETDGSVWLTMHGVKEQ